MTTLFRQYAWAVYFGAILPHLGFWPDNWQFYALAFPMAVLVELSKPKEAAR